MRAINRDRASSRSVSGVFGVGRSVVEPVTRIAAAFRPRDRAIPQDGPRPATPTFRGWPRLRHSGLRETPRRIGVWPDSVQALGGGSLLGCPPVTTRSRLLATTVGGDGHEPSATSAWGYLCRRARTRLNAEGLQRGHLDPPLDSAGHAKTEALGRVIGSLQPGRLVSSPATRAMQSASAIASGAGVEVIVNERDRPRVGPLRVPASGGSARRASSIDYAPRLEPGRHVLARTLDVLSEPVVHTMTGPLVTTVHGAIAKGSGRSCLLPGRHLE
jgi:hypothetical protein